MPQSFRCPSCAAPLEFAGGSSQFQNCEFCGNQIIVPDEARQAFASHFNFGGDLINQAHKLKEIKQLALSGKQIHAIKLYRETFGVGLKEAKDAVDNIVAGRPLVFTNFQTPLTISNETAESVAKAVGWSIGISTAIGIIAAIIGIGVAVIAVIFSITSATKPTTIASTTITTTSSTSTTITTTKSPEKPQFAREVFRFGGEGIGAGQFDDNRSIAVDGEGRIYSANYEGRIQAFDANGKFLTQWTVEGGDYAVYISTISADRSGKVYIPTNKGVRVFEGATGKELAKISENGSIADIAVALDGTLWAATWLGDIVHLSADGKQTLATFKNVAQHAASRNKNIEKIAVDGANNVYVMERENYYILKFNSKGEFLNRFGGKKDKFTKVTPPGKFDGMPHDFAVDGKGRVFVGETSNITVFDGEGGYLGNFETKQCFGMIFNDKDELWIASRPFVVKYAINQ